MVAARESWSESGAVLVGAAVPARIEPVLTAYALATVAALVGITVGLAGAALGVRAGEHVCAEESIIAVIVATACRTILPDAGAALALVGRTARAAALHVTFSTGVRALVVGEAWTAARAVQVRAAFD